MNNDITNLRFKTYSKEIIELDYITKFNLINNHRQGKIKEIVLNFSFKNIDFNKKKVIPFFMTLELITGQKCKITRSSQPVMALKLRKGAMVGCKVTLQKDNLYKFLDYLLLALPRSENFKGILIKKVKKSNNNTFSFNLEDLFTFYQAELDLNPIIQYLDVTFIMNTFSFEEKLFLLSSYKFPLINRL